MRVPKLPGFLRSNGRPSVINHADPIYIVSGFGSITASSIDGVARGKVVRMPDPRVPAAIILEPSKKRQRVGYLPQTPRTSHFRS
jgi:hypothetical protein